MHSYSFMNMWVVFLPWLRFLLASCLTHCPSREANGLARLVNLGREVRVPVWALPFFPLVKRKEAGSASPPEALLGTMPGSMCLTQRWNIHLPAPRSILGPRVQYKYQRELLCCFCLLQPDSCVCIPVEGSDLFSLLKPIPRHRHRQRFVASVRWSSTKDQLKLPGILTMTSRAPGLACSLAELSPQALLIPPVTKQAHTEKWKGQWLHITNS